MEIISTDFELNSCMEFGGTVNDYVIMNPYEQFPTDDITVSFWIKTTDVNGYVFSYATSSNDNTFLIGIMEDLDVFINTESGAFIHTGSTGIAVNDGNWHHLGVTWQSTNGELNIIKDGLVAFTGQLQAGNSIRISMISAMKI